GSLTEPDPNRILISLTPTDDSADRVPITIMLLPGGMTQAECAALSDAAIAKADAAGIRPEAESAAAGAGFKVTWWGGTERGMVGRRFGLITHYAFAHPDGRRHRKEIHVAYLGTQQVVVHVTLPAGPVTLLEREVRRILDSLRLRAEF